ncbi:MAG: hypothetical protein QXN96_05170 [Candidatus Bathyarchaeia archaeon]
MFENFHFLGGKKSKKQRKREVLEYNYTKGKIGEDLVAMKYTLMGYEVERTGRGSDFRVRKRDIFGRVIESKVIEVKTGRSKLSKLQKKMKKKKSNYRVEKVDPLFY